MYAAIRSLRRAIVDAESDLGCVAGLPGPWVLGGEDLKEVIACADSPVIWCGAQPADRPVSPVARERSTPAEPPRTASRPRRPGSPGRRPDPEEQFRDQPAQQHGGHDASGRALKSGSAVPPRRRLRHPAGACPGTACKFLQAHAVAACALTRFPAVSSACQRGRICTSSS